MNVNEVKQPAFSVILLQMKNVSIHVIKSSVQIKRTIHHP